VGRKPENLPPQEVAAGWRSIDSVADEVKALGRRAHTIWCDLTVVSEIQSMAEEAAAQFGHIDILVNNARAIIGRDRVPVTELKEEVWQHFLAINTTAVFLVTKYVAPYMLKQGRGGRIIHIASDAAQRGRRTKA